MTELYQSNFNNQMAHLSFVKRQSFVDKLETYLSTHADIYRFAQLITIIAQKNNNQLMIINYHKFNN